MNRVIKFRAWDTVDREWLSPGNFNIAGDGDILGWETDTEKVRHNDYAIEQFTGLLDKNGKEIYEGDILMETDNAGYVHWNSMGAYYQLVEVGRNGCPDLEVVEGSTPKLAVIGNIHENPELLK